MGKYCTVGLVNDLGNSYSDYFILDTTLGYYYDAAPLRLKLQFNKKVKVTIPMICEEFDNYFKDLITDKKFPKTDRSYSKGYKESGINNVILYKFSDLSSSQTAEIIKQINSAKMLKRYSESLMLLEKMVYDAAINYHASLQFQQQQEIDSENFIKAFRNRK